jgi:hypothetical protein
LAQDCNVGVYGLDRCVPEGVELKKKEERAKKEACRAFIRGSFGVCGIAIGSGILDSNTCREWNRELLRLAAVFTSMTLKLSCEHMLSHTMDLRFVLRNGQKHQQDEQDTI